MQHQLDASGPGVNESVRSSNMDEETTAHCTPSVMLDLELQPPEVVQEHSLHRAQTEDFEVWLRQDEPSPEQPIKKRIQQPTPEYDDNDTEDARRKRPRLAGEVCQNAFVDSGPTARPYRTERTAKIDVERQATVKELASPIKFGHLSEDRYTATNPPNPRTQPSDDASQGPGEARLIELPAYACTTQTRSLVSALAREAAAPPPREESNSEARLSSPSASAGSCAGSGYQSALQKPALVEQPAATLTQRLSGDQQAADMVRRAASMYQRAEDLDRQGADLASRAASMDQRVVDLDRRAADLDRRAADLDLRAGSIDQRVADLDQRAAELDQRALDMDRPAAGVWQRPADLDQRSADLEERFSDHDQRIGYLRQQSRAPSRQPSRASNHKAAQLRPGSYANGHFDDSDYSGSEDAGSVCANEEDAGHRLKAAHFSRGRLSSKQKNDLIRWKKEGRSDDWIAKQLNRKKENIPKLVEDARNNLSKEIITISDDSESDDSGLESDDSGLESEMLDHTGVVNGDHKVEHQDENKNNKSQRFSW
ncbi:hypothetical protein IF1G_11360 [Cordyceps javanica]|uniref:Uncharacterized protein n=1 Tax=Cordyceps javanica TaxID=43265 RepID=A0A545UKK1_9HYPO|nr:hypothetical protein IF1G_11360 [Cordyceps javanica]